MASSPATSVGSATGRSTNQDALTNWCRANNQRPPSWQMMSDRRGGRTAWSCTVTVREQSYPARFWYDGQFVNNAREDAAERALQAVGVLPPPPVPSRLQNLTPQQQPQQPQQLQQQQPQQEQQRPQRQQQQPPQYPASSRGNYYGPIGR